MNTLQHEYFHKLDDQRNTYKNHLLHASVDERASRTRTFAHTSDKWKLNVAAEFSEYVMNAYYQLNENTKADVMNLIDKFNRNNTGNIFLKFNPDARIMDIKINNLEKYALENVKYYNAINDIPDTKLKTLKRLNELYSHIEDQKGRDYYQEKINHFFYENIEMELPQKINNKDNLIKVESIVEECRYVSTFDGAFRAMNEDLVILRRTELPVDEKVKLENDIEKLYKNVLLISFLKKIELGSKYGPNNEINNPNYIINNNEILIKVQNAGDGGITIGYGCLIDSEEDAKEYGFKIYGLNNSIEQVIDEIERQESEYEEYDENPAMLSEEAAEKLLIQNMQEKSRYAEQLLGDKRTEFNTDEINGFVSALYNGGNIKNEDSFLYYLVRKDREGALDSIRRTEQGNGYDNQMGRLRRRLMEFNIFFNGDYTYYQDTELEKLKKDIGYYE